MSEGIGADGEHFCTSAEVCHLARVLFKDNRDVDVVVAKRGDGVACREGGVREARGVVVDSTEGVVPNDQPMHDALAGGSGRSRLKRDSSRRHYLPHDGR